MPKRRHRAPEIAHVCGPGCRYLSTMQVNLPLVVVSDRTGKTLILDFDSPMCSNVCKQCSSYVNNNNALP